MSRDRDSGSGRGDRGDSSERDARLGPIMKLFVVLLGLAGLGLGVWLFGRHRKGERPDE